MSPKNKNIARRADARKTVLSLVLALVMALSGIPANAVAEAVDSAKVKSEQAEQAQQAASDGEAEESDGQKAEVSSATSPTVDDPQPPNEQGSAPVTNPLSEDESPATDQDSVSSQTDQQPSDAGQNAQQPENTKGNKTDGAPSSATNTEDDSQQRTTKDGDATSDDASTQDKNKDDKNQGQDKTKDEKATEESKKKAEEKPAQSFAGVASNGVAVRASVDEGVFPAGTTMEVSAVDAQTARAIGAQVTDDEEAIVNVTAVDITFYDFAHNKIEPKDGTGVYVSLKLPDPVKVGDLVVAHQANNGVVQEVNNAQTNEAAGTTEFVGTEFSVYAVVETTKIVTFEFYESAEATVPVRTQVVREGDYLYAPAAVSGSDGNQLDGWCVEGETEKITFDDQGRHILTSGDINKANASNIVRVNASYAQYHDVVFWSNALGTGAQATRNVFSQLRVKTNSTISASDLPSTATLLESGQMLAGWATSEDSTEAALPANFSNVVVTADANYYPIIKASHVIHFDANRMKGMEEDAANGVKKITVSYTAPQVVAAGDVTVAPTEDPTVEGGAFVFAGWYEKDGSGNLKSTPFTWGEELTSDITLYAKWTPGTATYHVNVWKEKVTVRYDDSSRTSGTVNKNNYDFWTSYSYTAPVLTNGDYTYVSIADDVSGITTGIDNGFELRTHDQQKILLPDGSTEVNVYWNRKTQSVTFHEGSVVHEYDIKKTKDDDTTYYETEYWFDSFDVATTYTGLYEQPFEMYGWSWPSGSIGVYDDDNDGVKEHREGAWRRDFKKYEEAHSYKKTERKGTVRGNDIRTRIRGYFNDSLRENYYFRVEAPDPPSLYNVRQNIDGTWPASMDNANVIAVLNDAKNSYDVYDIYPHFTATGYSLGGFADENDRLAIPSDEEGKASLPKQEVESPPTRFLYFSRNKFHVTLYKDSSAQETVASNDEYYEAPLAKYANYTLPDTADKTFGGWYYAPGVTDPTMAIKWDRLTMPANNIVVYPIWVPNSVNVCIDLGADDATIDERQSRSFWASLGDTIDMTYLNAATRSDHVLSGWYLPNNTSEAAWSEGQEIGAKLCDMANGKVTKTEDPNYHNYYYTLTLRAKWAYARAAKVRYDLNGGTGDIPNSTESYLFGSKVKVTTQIPTPPAGKQFLAWQDAVEATDAQEGLHTASHVPGSTFAYDDEGMVTTEGGQDYIVLKALYVTHNAPTSTITYHPNYAGATSNPKVSDSYEWDDQITLPGDTFTRDGYELAGWSDHEQVADEGALLLFAGQTVTVSAMGTNIDDITNKGNNDLYAVWRKILAVEGKSATLEYNGAEQSVAGLKPNTTGYDNPRFQGDGGDWVEVVSDTAVASGTNVGTYTGTVKSTKVLGTEGADAGQDISERFMVESSPGTLTITPRNMNTHGSEVGITLANAGAYDGTQKKPAATVTVTIDGQVHTLVEGTDFTVEYANNISAAESTATNAPLATVTFKGNYTGTASKTFSIDKATVMVTPKQAQSKMYGEDDPVLEYDAAGLVGSDTLTGALGRVEGENAGEYAYTLGTLAGGSNYAVVLASDTSKFAIAPKPLTFTWPATTTFEYDGNEKSIAATIADGLVKSGDVVTLTYENNAKTNVGSYTAKVLGLEGASAGNYYVASDEPTASQAWSITKTKQAQPTVTTHTGTTGKTASDGTVKVTPAVGTTAEYSTDGGKTWTDVPESGTITSLPAGDVLVRTKEDANHEPSEPITQTVGYKLTGTIYWDYTYSTPTNPDGTIPDESAWSKYAIVTLSDGSQRPRTVSVVAQVKSGSTAEGTYEFKDVPINAPVSVSIVPTMTADATEKAANYTVTMRANNLDADVNYSAECFDAAWRVDIEGVGTVDGVVPDTVYVKVLFVEDEADKNDLTEYYVIVQQRDSEDGTIKRNGAACTLSAGTDPVAYTATGSYPVWTQKAGGGTYYHKAQVVGYTVNGTYIDCSGKNYVSVGAMTYDTTTSTQDPNPMVVTINNLDVLVLEFNPNGEGATVATPYVLGSAYGGAVPAATISGNTATWTGYKFEGWYDSAAKNNGNKVEGPVTLNGKTTLYAHWSQNQAAPTGLSATKASSTTQATISGVTTEMEYSTNDGTTWQDGTDSAITLESDVTSVQVRYKAVSATDAAWPKNASLATTVTIQKKAKQAEPTLTATKASTDTTTDATVTVADYNKNTKPAQYQVNSGEWQAVSDDGIITGLKKDDVVQVKYTETADYEASEPVSATVGVKDQQTIKPVIQAASATTVRVTNPQPGVTYTLCDTSGTAVPGIDSITATDSEAIEFEDCTPGTTYTVMPSIVDDANTHYTCELSDSATTPKLDIVIGTATPTVLNTIYNRAAQALVEAPASLPEGCTKILYSIADDGWTEQNANWTEDVPTAVDAGTYTIKVKYLGDATHNDASGADLTARIEPRSLKDADYGIQVLAMPIRFIYSGEAQGPKVTVLDHATFLSPSTASKAGDYTVSYGTATNVGNYTLTVTGTGNYKDSVDRDFAIVPYAVNSTDKLVVDLGTDEFTYNGAVQRPNEVTVTLNGAQLVEGVDYDLAYLDKDGQEVASVDAGAYQVKVTLKGNYEGQTAAGYTIVPKQIVAADVTATPTSFVYSGAAQGPVFSVATALAAGLTATTLANGADYTLTGNTATGAGTYTAIVAGTGNFTGTVEKQFTIAPYKMGADDKLVVAFQGGDKFVYNGKTQKPSNVTVTLNDAVLNASEYTVGWPDESKDAGAYSVTVTLGDNYNGTKTATLAYTIAPKPLTSDDVTLGGETLTFSGTSQGPTVTVTSQLTDGQDKTTLVSTDYILSGATATDAGTHTLTVTGTGNYTGTVQKSYSIAKATGTVDNQNKPTALSLVYNGEPQELVTPPAELPEGYVKVQYGTSDGSGGTTWSDSVPTGTSAREYPIQVKYVGDKNHNDIVGDELNITASIAQRRVTFTGETASKVFNGREQELTRVQVGGEHGLVDGHTHNVTSRAAGTNVGEHNGTIAAAADVVIKDAQDADVTANYAIITTPGKLTITKAPLADSGKGDGLLANDEGKPITVNGTITGDLAKQVPLVHVTGTNRDTIYDGEDHVPVVKDAVTGNVLPADAYAVAYYNAADIENGRPKAGATQLTGDDATKNAGERVAVVTFTEQSNYVTGDTIAVSMSLQPRPIILSGVMQSVEYDGQPHTATGVTVGGSGLVSGHTHNATFSATGTDRGTYDGTEANPATSITPAEDVTIMAGAANVTANYNITTVNGRLTIGAVALRDGGDGKGYAGDVARVLVEFSYDDAVYDGGEHKPTAYDILKDNEQLTEDEDYTVAFYHKDDVDEDGDPAEGAVPLDATVAADDKVAIVTFTKDYTGTVKVNAPVGKRAVTLAGVSATKMYTGAEQSVTGVEDTGDIKLVSGHTHNVTATAKGTDAGAHAGTITVAADVKIADAQGADVTANYAVSTVPGTLTITPLAVNDGMPTSKINPVSNGGDPTDAKTVVNVTGSNPDDTEAGHNTPGTSSSDSVPVYDGKEHGPSVTDSDGKPLVPGVDYDVTYYDSIDIDSATGLPKDGAKPLDPTDAGAKVAVVTFKGNYSGVVNVPVEISPRPIRVTTQAASRNYDGTPLVAKDDAKVWVAGEDGVPEGCGLIDQQTVEVVVTGSQTDAGSSSNTYTLRFADTAAASAESSGGIRAEASDSAYSGVAQDGSPTAKSGNYVDQSEPSDAGTLTVAPAELTVITPSASKVYDGKALVKSEGAKVNGLAQGETATVKCTGTQTKVGSSKNTYTLEWGSAKKDNYTVTKEDLGTLTVTKGKAAATSLKTPTSTTGGTGSTSRSSLARTTDTTSHAVLACLVTVATALLVVALVRRRTA